MSGCQQYSRERGELIQSQILLRENRQMRMFAASAEAKVEAALGSLVASGQTQLNVPSLGFH